MFFAKDHTNDLKKIVEQQQVLNENFMRLASQLSAVSTNLSLKQGTLDRVIDTCTTLDKRLASSNIDTRLHMDDLHAKLDRILTALKQKKQSEEKDAPEQRKKDTKSTTKQEALRSIDDYIRAVNDGGRVKRDVLLAPCRAYCDENFRELSATQVLAPDYLKRLESFLGLHGKKAQSFNMVAQAQRRSGETIKRRFISALKKLRAYLES